MCDLTEKTWMEYYDWAVEVEDKMGSIGWNLNPAEYADKMTALAESRRDELILPPQ